MNLIFFVPFFLLIIMLSSNPVFAAEEIYTGEEYHDLYYGPLNPFFVKHKTQLILQDQIYFDRVVNAALSPSFFELANFYQTEVNPNFSCPEYYFQNNIAYSRYLFRLLTISYLYESIKKYHYTLYSLGGEIQTCPRDLKKLLQKCVPQSDDMKMFVQRASHFFDRINDEQKYKRMDDVSKKRWLETFSFRKHVLIPASRISSWCQKNHKNCDKITIQDAIGGLKQSCAEDLQLVDTLCREVDDIYGLSYSKIALELIKTSHSKKMINDGGYGDACLDHFQRTFKYKERKYYQLNEIFRVVFETLKNNKSVYMQGHLFLPGALKEFDDLGVNDFLYTPPKVVVKTPVKVTPAKPKPHKALPIPFVKPPVVERRPIVSKQIEVPAPKIVAKKLSYFEESLLKFEQSSEKKLALDTELYRNDYSFRSEFIAKMKGQLEIYQTRMAIEDMLKYDKIGSHENPMQVSFLKYLIDFDLHQGLFNIISILGKKFYIRNDLEGKKKPVYIILLNDETTDYRWQVSFVRPEVIQAEKK